MAAPMDESPKTKFQALYASKRTPGSWKEKYRKRCFDNLRKNRANLLAKFRHVTDDKDPDSSVRTIMEQEWRMLQYEDDALPNVQMDEDGFKLTSSSNQEVETMISVLDEIQKELRQQEQALIREYESSLTHEQDALNAEVNRQSTGEVICPVCQRNPMMENASVIFCRCGVRINTEADGLHIRHLAANLEEGTNLHSSCCTGNPKFSVLCPVPGVENIVMTCQSCEFMFIVI